MRKKILFAVLGLVLVAAGWVTFRRPPEGAARFVDTFRYQLLFGSQEVTLNEDGTAHYTITYLNEKDESVTEVADGGWRVIGDTAFVGLKPMRAVGAPVQPGKEARNDSLVMLLQGKDLVQLNYILGASVVFERR
jgi:hypothetical protein